LRPAWRVLRVGKMSGTGASKASRPIPDSFPSLRKRSRPFDFAASGWLTKEKPRDGRDVRGLPAATSAQRGDWDDSKKTRNNGQFFLARANRFSVVSYPVLTSGEELSRCFFRSPFQRRGPPSLQAAASYRGWCPDVRDVPFLCEEPVVATRRVRGLMVGRLFVFSSVARCGQWLGRACMFRRRRYVLWSCKSGFARTQRALRSRQRNF
jgi:hypothetical protein